jgi:regulation of enolase protein 1 (concanavalin A-like superfamily)
MFMVPSKPAAKLLIVISAIILCMAARQDAKVIPGWGEPIDPSRDCEIRLEGSALVISVPAKPHQLRAESGKRNAPRVLRYIESHFQTQVKVAGDFEADSSASVAGQSAERSAGLLLWQDERNFVILARAYGGEQPRGTIALTYWKDGQIHRESAAEPYSPELEGKPTWLRLTRRLDKLTAETSSDGESWNAIKTLPIRLSSRLRLGVLATNTSKQPLSARFEEFRFRNIPLTP